MCGCLGWPVKHGSTLCSGVIATRFLLHFDFYWNGWSFCNHFSHRYSLHTRGLLLQMFHNNNCDFVWFVVVVMQAQSDNITSNSSLFLICSSRIVRETGLNMFMLSVWDCVLCRSGWTDREAIWVVHFSGQKELYSRLRFEVRWKGQFCGGRIWTLCCAVHSKECIYSSIMAWQCNCCHQLQCCRLVDVTLNFLPWKIHPLAMWPILRLCWTVSFFERGLLLGQFYSEIEIL